MRPLAQRHAPAGPGERGNVVMVAEASGAGSAPAGKVLTVTSTAMGKTVAITGADGPAAAKEKRFGGLTKVATSANLSSEHSQLGFALGVLVTPLGCLPVLVARAKASRGFRPLNAACLILDPVEEGRAEQGVWRLFD